MVKKIVEEEEKEEEEKEVSKYSRIDRKIRSKKR